MGEQKRSTKPLVVSLDEAATLLSISRETVQNMIHDNELPAKKVRGQWRIPLKKIYEVAGVEEE